MNIKKRVHKFEDLLSKLLDYESLDSQYMISLVEEFTMSINELPNEGCDSTDQATRDTWGSIEARCRELLDAFEPKSAKDKDALCMLYMDSNSICGWMDVHNQGVVA
mgnify:FL=1